MNIPIRNVFYLLCYAWDHYEEGEAVGLGVEEPRRLQDLLGYMLGRGVAQILRRGLHREYVTEESTIGGIRGRLLLGETVKRQLLHRGQTYCRFDELTHDVVHNRIVASTLTALVQLEDLDSAVRRDLRRLRHRLGQVGEVRLHSSTFRRVRLHRNNRLYGFVLAICRLVAESLLVDGRSGEVQFRDLRHDAVRMWEVFQAFVFHFYRREQCRFAVGAPIVLWQDARGTEADLRRLPVMKTDVVLSSAQRTIVLDTKFYQNPLQESYGQKKVSSGNLYQICSYLANWGTVSEATEGVEGLLLYPVVEDAFYFDYVLNGKRVRVATIDLGQPWQRIHTDLLGLIG